MTVHEPLLDFHLSEGEQETKPTEFLYFQHRNPMGLCHVPDARFCKQSLGGDGGHAVEGIVDYPVKHFDEEGEPLEDAAVDVGAESRSVGHGEYAAAPPANLGRMFASRCNFIFAISVGVVREEAIGCAGRV